MIPQKFTVTGLTGVLAGLGLEVLSMDFTKEIPEDARTIALKGDNGSGKSTLLNLALTPFREPPQMHGNLYDQCQPGKSVRDLEWTHEGELYHSVITVNKTAKTSTMTAILHVMDKGEWFPVGTPDGTVSDGKSGTYDACLEHILGSKDLYYMTAFRAQKATSIAEHDDAKGLLTELMNLGEAKRLAKEAHEIGKGLKAEVAQYKGLIDSVDEAQEAIVLLAPWIKDARDEIGPLLAKKVEAVGWSSTAAAKLAEAQTAEGENEKVREQRQEYTTELETIKSESDSRIRAIEQRRREADDQVNCHNRDILDNVPKMEAELSTLEYDLNKAEDATAVTVRRLRTEIEGLERRIAGYREVLGMEEAINMADQDVIRITQDIQEAEAKLEELRAEKEAAGEMNASRTAETEKQRGIGREGKALKDQLEELTMRAGYSDQVPCEAASEPYNTCPALQEALSAAGLIPPKEEAISAKTSEWKACATQITDFESQIIQIGDGFVGDIRAMEISITALRSSLEISQGIASKRESLSQASEIIEAATSDIEARETDIRETTLKMESVIRGVDVRKDGIKAACVEKNDRLREAIEKLQAQADAIGAEKFNEIKTTEVKTDHVQAKLDALPPVDAADALARAREEVDSAERAQAEVEQLVAQAQARLAAKEEEKARLDTVLEKAPMVAKLKAAIEEEIGLWNLLNVGLKGTIDLCIEDAGPSIAKAANDLLRATFGPRFTLKIVTQREQGNGVLKEVFDISVLDQESGIESSMLHKSGGQCVWLDKALTEAVGLYHQEVAGRNYECAFADETEDGLTEERKAQFHRMERMALDLCGYSRKFVISHHPGAIAEADFVIDLDAMKAA